MMMILVVIFYLIVVLIIIQLVRFQRYYNQLYLDNDHQELFYSIKTSPAINNHGFQQPKILMVSSIGYLESDLQSLPYRLARKYLANLDYLKIKKPKILEIEKGLEKEIKNKRISILDYHQIIIVLENSFCYQLISRSEILRQFLRLFSFFRSRGFRGKINIQPNFITLDQEAPFPYNYYYHHQRKNFQEIVSTGGFLEKGLD
jgi:hypothetical protein